jgi:hypothetical protein
MSKLGHLSAMMIWRKVLVVFLVFLGLYIATSGGHLYSPDEEIMFRMTESLARHGTFSVEPMLDAQGRSFATRRGVDGKEYPQYGLGNPLFAVPFYWVGDWVARIVDPARAEQLLGFRTVMYVPEAEGKAGPALVRRFAVSFFGAFVGAASCALLWLFAFRLRTLELQGGTSAPASRVPPQGEEQADTPTCGREAQGLSPTATAWLVAVSYGAGTMALPHARTFFSEPLATFFVVASFYMLFRGGAARLSTAFLAGLFYALALLTRLDSAVVGPALGLYFLLRYLEERSSSPHLWTHSLRLEDLARQLFTPHFFSRVASFAAAPCAFAVVQFGLNWLHFGNPFTSAYADQPEGIQFRTPLLAGLYGYFMSIGKSIFLFSPAIVLGLAGWRRFASSHPALAYTLAIATAMLIIFHGRWQNWAGGWCWGPRHIFMVHALVMLWATGFAVPWNRMRRLALVVILPIAFGVQLYGASQNFIDFYILYYRTPETQPNAYVMYSNEDLTPMRAIAPINDSIYVPQNSQWYRYAEMWQLGYTDNLWLRLWKRAQGTELPIR